MDTNVDFDKCSMSENPEDETKSVKADQPLGEEDETPINDDEFNIPPVDFEPTLESILNDGGDDLSISDDGNESQTANSLATSHNQNGHLLDDGQDNVSLASRGSSDNRSRNSSRSLIPRGNLFKKKPSSILRHVLLKEMSTQVTSANERLNGGSPTCLAMGHLVEIGTLTAIGTSHGHIFVLDPKHQIRYCFGDSNHREEGGAVTSLAISYDGTRLLAGYAKGLILMYNLENGKLLRSDITIFNACWDAGSINDAHAPGTAVLVIRFSDNSIRALFSDSGGSVFELTFKRTMGIRGTDSRCIFSGSRGEVCTFEPLSLVLYPDNKLSKFFIVALATLSKVIVVMIRPKLKVLFTHSLDSDPSTLPLVAWQMVIIQTAQKEQVVDPVLTFARDNFLFFYQMTIDSKNTIHFLPLQKITVNYQILNINWLNVRTLAIIDIKERIRVMDVRSQEELESLDLTQVKLVYASSHFKGLATGGNVSRAFALAGERACYNSILCVNTQMVILGLKSIHVLTMRSWCDRLDYLTSQFHFVEALHLAYEIYCEKGKAIINLTGSKKVKKRRVREKLLDILNRYVDRLPRYNFMDDLNTAKQNYQEVISTSINYYIQMGDREPIFEQLYEYSSSNPISKSAFLESLEPFILNDQLRSIPPSIVKEFISHYEEIGNFKALEVCIVHINVDSLDIHQTMKLCWMQGLYDAIIYIFNQGMNDYISPLEELMTELQNSLATESSLTDSQIALGNKILVYTSCCLAGRAYPYGNIPGNLVEKVQSDIFRLITTLHTRNSTESEEAYPYLRIFLLFDTREFLNVLFLSFEEPIFKTELGRRQIQRMVDILLQVMVEHGSFTPTQVGVLFTFLARQMAKADGSLFVSKLLFEQVLEHLTSKKEVLRTDERQQALLELLQAGGLQHFDPQRLLEKCLNAKFYRVAEMLYDRKQEYDKIIDCYLFDDSRSNQVFSVIHKIFCIKPSKKEEFHVKIKEILPDLVVIDNKKTAQVIYYHMSHKISDFVKSLTTNPEKQYLLMQGIFYMREENYSNIHIDTQTTEKYIELMCKFNPQLVYPFLKSFDSYRADFVMEICKKFKLIEAQGFLLEKDGKIDEAFKLMLDQLKEKLNRIIDEVENGSHSKHSDGEKPIEKKEDEDMYSLTWSQLEAHFLVIVQFSQRNSPKVVSEKRESLWLPPLELLIAANNKSQGKMYGYKARLNELTKHLLSSMIGHVSLTTIVEIVMNDPSYENATFAEIRYLVMGMLETCTYEEMMVSLVKRITQADVHEKLYSKVKLEKHGFARRNNECPACQMCITPDNPSRMVLNVVVFHCGHSYHYDCCQVNGMQNCGLCRVSNKRLSKENVENHFIATSSKSFSDELSSVQRLENKESEIEENHSSFKLSLDALTKTNLNGKF